MKIRTFLDDVVDNLPVYLTKVTANRNALLNIVARGGVATITISQNQIRGMVKHKDGTETKLKTFDIKVRNSRS